MLITICQGNETRRKCKWNVVTCEWSSGDVTDTDQYGSSFLHFIFPGSSADKESTCNGGDPRSIPGSGRSPGEGIGYSLHYSWDSLVTQMVKNLPVTQETWVQSLGWEHPLQYSGLENSMDRGAWQATVNGIDCRERLLLRTRDVSPFKILEDSISQVLGCVCVCVCVCVLVAQLCLTLCGPINCSPPGSFVYGILQARILEWVAISFSKKKKVGMWHCQFKEYSSLNSYSIGNNNTTFSSQ